MNRLDHHPDVLGLARSLGLAGSGEASRAIVAFCREKVEGWMREAGPISSIQALQELICAKLGLVFEHIRSAAELQSVVGRYVAEGEVVFASLPGLFDAETFATLIRRRGGAGRAAGKYVAVIDCRGRKASRSFFSRWHEIAHLLAMAQGGMEQPVHRSTSRRSAVELLMDRIAGEIAFSEFLFRPVLEVEAGPGRALTFAAVERVRRRYAPEASCQATLVACVKQWAQPVLYLEAGLALTRSEEERFDREAVPARRPAPKLRVQKVVRNEAARAVSFYVPPGMEVPAESVLSGLFFGGQALGEPGDAVAFEDLSAWRHSDGSALRARRVWVQARTTDEQVMGLLCPVGDRIGDGSLS